MHRVETCNTCKKEWNISKLTKIRGKYVCPNCQNEENERAKKKMEKVRKIALRYTIICFLSALLYLNMSYAAQIERGYKAYGGECGALFIPIMAALVEGERHGQKGN